jgi:hypothetical protein
MWRTKCEVINFKQYGSIQALNQAFGDRWAYIGRANKYARLPASPLANPFKVKDFGGRGQTLLPGSTLGHYRRWLWERIQAGDEALLDALKAIDDRTMLVCWCKPGPCHGDVVKAAAEWIQAQCQHVAFVSGHRDLTPVEFYQQYQPQLDKAIAAGHRFVVGDAPGADTLAQMYLVGRVAPERVTVYHAGHRSRHHSGGFAVRGGYVSQSAKDAAMTAVSDHDIVWVRPGKTQSGTARNLARRR